jgi:hypothetical protein
MQIKVPNLNIPRIDSNLISPNNFDSVFKLIWVSAKRDINHVGQDCQFFVYKGLDYKYFRLWRANLCLLCLLNCKEVAKKGRANTVKDECGSVPIHLISALILNFVWFSQVPENDLPFNFFALIYKNIISYSWATYKQTMEQTWPKGCSALSLYLGNPTNCFIGFWQL